MDRCDVLIVGGGPAGTSCAWGLRHAGLDVILLDKAVFPRDKVCAGWITPEVIESLQIDLQDYCLGRVMQPIRAFRTGLIGGQEVTTDFGKTVGYGIRRCEFDHYLLDRCNVRRRLGVSVTSLEHDDHGWLINGEIRASLLIGAGGHFCPVSRNLQGVRTKNKSLVTAQEVEFEVAEGDLHRIGIEPDRPELYFCGDLMGYGWCFRKGNYLNVGLGRVDSKHLAAHVSAFCQFLVEHGKIGCEIPADFHGHAYQLYEDRQSRLIDEHAILLGDAAGLAYPQSGEGIRPAVESGLLAAEVILTAKGRYTSENLEPYRRAILARFGKSRTSHLAGALPTRWLHLLGSRLMGSKWFTRRIVLGRWFLHAGVPALPT